MNGLEITVLIIATCLLARGEGRRRQQYTTPTQVQPTPTSFNDQSQRQYTSPLNIQDSLKFDQSQNKNQDSSKMAASLTPDQRNHADHISPDGFVCPQEVGLFPHPSICNAYISCSPVNRGTFVQVCPPGLVFNGVEGYCDFDFNVDCQGKDLIEIIYKKPEVKSKVETIIESEADVPADMPLLDDLPAQPVPVRQRQRQRHIPRHISREYQPRSSTLKYSTI